MKTIKIKYFKSPFDTHISQVLVGYKLLERGERIKLDIISSTYNFREIGQYEHNAIVEVEIDGIIIAYDLADGYQSIHRKDVFDKQLERINYYFKRSYDPTFHKGTNSAHKVYPLGLNYYCTCIGNPLDKFEWKSYSLKELRRFISYLRGERKWLRQNDYTNFVSNNHFNKYKLLFLTRIWDSSGITPIHIRRHYPYLNDDESLAIANQWKESLDKATNYRIKLIRALRKEFGDDLFVGGVSQDAFSEQRCPDLLVAPTLTSKKSFMQLCKSNYICIASQGLHNSIGWKLAEYVANARTIITDPLYYSVTGDFEENTNYLVYNNVEECIQACHALLRDVDRVHKMEQANAEYYKSYLAPDVLIKRTLRTAGVIV